MNLNTLKPAPGAKTARKRVGRGIGSGLGKTCGRGHKGQRARAGGFHKVGFEGGQMPLQRRLPKFGFTNVTAKPLAELRLDLFEKLDVEIIDIQALKDADLIGHKIKRVKIIASGKLTKAIHLRGIATTKNAKAAIEAAGGKVED